MPSNILCNPLKHFAFVILIYVCWRKHVSLSKHVSLKTSCCGCAPSSTRGHRSRVSYQNRASFFMSLARLSSLSRDPSGFAVYVCIRRGDRSDHAYLIAYAPDLPAASFIYSPAEPISHATQQRSAGDVCTDASARARARRALAENRHAVVDICRRYYAGFAQLLPLKSRSVWAFCGRIWEMTKRTSSVVMPQFAVMLTCDNATLKAIC